MFRVRTAVTWGAMVIVLWAGGVAELAAQQQPGEALVPTRLTNEPEGRFFVSLDGGGQAGSQLLQDSGVTRQVFGEDQVVDTEYDIARGSGLFRANMSYRVWRNVGVGIGFTRSAATGMADVNAEVPHPVFVARPRVASSTLTNMAHRENMFLIQGVWMTQLDEQVSVHIFGGPTLIRVDQAVVVGATTREVGPPFSAVDITRVRVAELEESGVGFNVGVDLSYILGPGYGLGVFVQYTGGSTDFDLLQGPTSITVGGLQFGGGLRLRLF